MPTFQEQSCINYDLHTDNDNGNVFMFHENWESKQDLNNHHESAFIKKVLHLSAFHLENLPQRYLVTYLKVPALSGIFTL